MGGVFWPVVFMRVAVATVVGCFGLRRISSLHHDSLVSHFL